ncbi:peptidase inhibitor family I36 [Herbihabitans rhizosphaerae]|uniref:Peptidase inhibitor family I36 n=1 Tax=Herbihabitans rhizosphaerae TaxID=1872711 RepID=A0A4Q7L4U1_9PSEU|nr:peptidase inhibitor family I36 protein [Herbihabitans rhizosphaerae]RZS44254.1 peptidase inhibitor family I36 [Herbihabitans rhizosphaerae]
MRNSVRVAAVVAAMAAGTIGVGATAQAGTIAAPPAPADPTVYGCDRGLFCLWPGEQYRGPIHTIDPNIATAGECVPLPEGVDARSFVNRTEKHITVYQARNCDTEEDFSTYPGGGTFVPQAPFTVRGVQVWS